jgi:hypothetical protein
LAARRPLFGLSWLLRKLWKRRRGVTHNCRTFYYLTGRSGCS